MMAKVDISEEDTHNMFLKKKRVMSYGDPIFGGGVFPVFFVFFSSLVLHPL